MHKAPNLMTTDCWFTEKLDDADENALTRVAISFCCKGVLFYNFDLKF